MDPCGLAGRRPQAAAVGLDDGSADEEAHTHPVRLRREECIEDPAPIFRIDPRSCVLQRDQHLMRLLNLGFDHQQSGPLPDQSHGIDGIHGQIQEDLLQLDRIGQDLREAIGQLGFDEYAMPLQPAVNKHENFANEVVDAKHNFLVIVLFENRPDTFDHLAGAMGIVDDLRQCRPRLIDVGCRTREPAQAGASGCRNRRQRLVDFVSDGCRHGPHRRQPCNARELQMVGAFLRAHLGKLGEHLIEGCCQPSNLVVTVVINSQVVVVGLVDLPRDRRETLERSCDMLIGHCSKKNTEEGERSDEREAAVHPDHQIAYPLLEKAVELGLCHRPCVDRAPNGIRIRAVHRTELDSLCVAVDRACPQTVKVRSRR